MAGSINEVKNYWETQGKKFSDSCIATTPDELAFQLETKEIIKNIKDGQSIINIGCGNGIKEIEICKNRKVNIDSVDYSEEMIKAAKVNFSKEANMIGNANFFVGDVLNLKSQKKYDVAITVRCLINLNSHESQIKAINNILDVIKPGGMYLMLENTKEGLAAINKVRTDFILPNIEERWHNNYLNENEIIRHIQNKKASVEIVNFNSTYFLISRTLNALLTPPGEKINYLSDVNKYATELPALGNYSPLKLFKISL